MYEQILTDIKQAYYQTHFANDGQRFIAWYLRRIHNLEPFEAESCITDGPGDKQIDAVYVDDASSVVYIIQGKFYAGEHVDAEPVREVLSSWMYIKDLAKLQENANDRLKAKICDLATALQDNYDVCFELITTAKLTSSAQADFEAFQTKLSDDDELSATLTLVDDEVIQIRYEEALNKNRPYINYEFPLPAGNYVMLDLDGTKAIIVALPLKDCIMIPGIKDGSLFRRNVRQSLGLSNKINKGIARTLRNNPKDFFFYHNGITAICSEMHIEDNRLYVKELNVVNGCQSLSTIYSCSEAVRNCTNGYIMFRFYEISDTEKADAISNSTNSQSAVKARDLRSNDKSIIAIKKAYEQCYTDGYFVTKRGETADSAKYNTAHIVYMTDLGKQLVAWHSQRPTIAYSETRIFDKYFDQIFHKDYPPENIQALKELFDAVILRWSNSNPLDFHPDLFSVKAYAPYHHLFTISFLACEINKMPESVPNPAILLSNLKQSNMLDGVVDLSGIILNIAYQNALSEASDERRTLSTQNWTKAKASLKCIRDAARSNLNMMRMNPTSRKTLDELTAALRMDSAAFESRWSAD